jgi:glycolate oxidase FAD binding subunit
LYSKKLPIEPQTPEQLSEALALAANRRKTISLGGNFSKLGMAGPSRPADVTITTARMNRILQYEPTDLTLSVEAGTAWSEVTRLLAANNQMIPLDPPLAGHATVGGVIATNSTGPRRRLYGSARDLVIGMKFATLEGKLVQSGGMVVKNVAGLDMGKLLIGSFGTLAAIAVVNFKLTPKPAIQKTILLSFDTLEEALNARGQLMRGVLQPAAIDLLNPLAAADFDEHCFLLVVQFGGNAAVVARYEREIGSLGDWLVLEGADEEDFWRPLHDFAPLCMARFPAGAVVRISSTVTQLGDVLSSLKVRALARAANGITYAAFDRAEEAAEWMKASKHQPWKCVIDFAPEAQKSRLDLWPSPGGDFGMMKKIKQMFDPGNLLNNGRLYRLI